MDILLADTSQHLHFMVFQSDDHITPKTGASFTGYFLLANGSAQTFTPTVVEKDSTNMPGLYTVAADVANMVASPGTITLYLKATGADNVAVSATVVDLLLAGVNDNIDAVALNVIDVLADTNELQTDWVNGGRLDLLLDDVPTVAEFEARSIVSDDYVVVGDTIAGVTLVGTTTTNTDMVGTDGANTVVPDAAGVAPTVAEIRIEMDTNSTKMAPSQTLADYKATGFSVPSEYDTVIAALQTDLDNPAQYKADVSALATAAALTTHDGKLDTVDTNVDAILVDTNELQTDWANGGRLDLIIDLILADTAELQTDWTNDGRLDIILDAVKTKTDNLPSGIAKNVALPKLDVFMVLSSDHVTSAIGKTITGEISKDGGAFTGITNAITEVGSGLYIIADGLTQIEMNADIVTLKFTETDCDQRTITIHTS